MESYVRNQDYDAVQLDGEWIILNTEEYTVTTLNEVGGFCWDILRKQHSLDEIIQVVQEHYVCKGETIRPDIQEFLVDLLKYGLIKHES
jgi:formylmethanofuran dehydrogenase subunit A